MDSAASSTLELFFLATAVVAWLWYGAGEDGALSRFILLVVLFDSREFIAL